MRMRCDGNMANENKYSVKDISLAASGLKKITWAESRMPVLLRIKERFVRELPFKGKTIGMCLHVTKETAVLAKAVKAGGGTVGLCASNPLSTQDDVAAALVEEVRKRASATLQQEDPRREMPSTWQHWLLPDAISS